MASQPRRLCFESSLPRKPQISHSVEMILDIQILNEVLYMVVVLISKKLNIWSLNGAIVSSWFLLASPDLLQ